MSASAAFAILALIFALITTKLMVCTGNKEGVHRKTFAVFSLTSALLCFASGLATVGFLIV